MSRTRSHGSFRHDVIKFGESAVGTVSVGIVALIIVLGLLPFTYVGLTLGLTNLLGYPGGTILGGLISAVYLTFMVLFLTL